MTTRSWSWRPVEKDGGEVLLIDEIHKYPRWSNIINLKKLLGVLSESVPFTPNISSLANKLKLGRDTVNTFLLHLEKARMLNLLHQHTKGVAILQKPDKIYFENTNPELCA